MGKLSLLTKVYIIVTLIAGTVLFALFAPRWDWQNTWIQAIVLSVLATLTLLFRVEGSTDKTHYDITFLIYGLTIILYGAPLAVIVIVVAHVLEWFWHRYPWYIQAFNIGSYIIVAVGTNMVYELANPTRGLVTWQAALSMLAAMAFFTLLNHLMVGLIVWMARGENFVQSGIFQLFPLMLDGVMLCMGAGMAVVWTFNPFAVVLVLLPLYLIYTTLRVPALERQVETDPKTGLYNLNFFMTSLDNELARASRFERPLTIVMADIDLLRNINNLYGHLAGDVVLIGIAKILKDLSREYDIVARFGGEEFSVMMPETTPEVIFTKVEAMRLAIEKAEFVVTTSVTPIKATMSFGIAGYEAGLEGKDIIHNADLALYHAKLSGRNRAFIYSKEGYKGPYESHLTPESLSQLAESGLAYPILPAAGMAPPMGAAIPAGSGDEGKAPPEMPVTETAPQAGEKTNADESAESVTADPAHRKHSRLWVNGYIACLVLAAVGLFLISNPVFNPLDWLGILVFVILVAATEWASIDIYVRNTAVSTSAVALIAGVLLFGPVGALILSLTMATVAFIKHHSRISRFFFNWANQLFATLILLVLIHLTGSQFIGWSLPLQVLVSALAAMLVFLLTSFCIAIGISIDFNELVLKIWQEQYSWLAPYYLVMGVIASALIFSYLHSGVLGTVVILIPLVLLRISQKQFVDRTRATVTELNRKNKILEMNSKEITRLNNGLLDTLAEVINLRDPYILGHSRRVTEYAVLIAQQMGLSADRIEVIRKASLMHDLGKLGIEPAILAKPTKLTEQEYAQVKRHPSYGAELIRKSQALQSLIPVVLHHHERYDGKGYPDGLSGKDIPLEARIVSLADAVDAMASDRPYRPGLSFEQILEEVRRCSGSQFDPLIVNIFELLVRKTGRDLIKNTNPAPAVPPTADSR